MQGKKRKTFHIYEQRSIIVQLHFFNANVTKDFCIASRCTYQHNCVIDCVQHVMVVLLMLEEIYQRILMSVGVIQAEIIRIHQDYAIPLLCILHWQYNMQRQLSGWEIRMSQTETFVAISQFFTPGLYILFCTIL